MFKVSTRCCRHFISRRPVAERLCFPVVCRRSVNVGVSRDLVPGQVRLVCASRPAVAFSHTAAAPQQQQQPAPAAAESIPENKTNVQPVLISASAARKLNEIKSAEQQPRLALRLAVDGGGCSGFQYNFEMTSIDDLEGDDMVFERDGAQFVVDTVSYELVAGALVDFEQEIVRSSFVVKDNPNASTQCGCGVSFDAK